MQHVAAGVETYLSGLGAGWRRVSELEWGLTVEAAGWPLHIGLAVRGGLLRAQAEALAPDQVSDHELLHRNRGMLLARYTHAGDGTVWVEADLPPAAVDPEEVDRLLGCVVEAATVVRWRAASRAPSS